MAVENILLQMPDGRSVARARVEVEGGRLGGTFQWTTVPADVRAACEEFEELVGTGVLSLTDAAEEAIAVFDIRAVFDGGGEFRTADLQLYPAEGTLGFRLGEPVARQSFGPVERAVTRSAGLGELV